MLNWTDWVIVAILVISGLISLKRGFVREALSLAIWAIAFAVAVVFSPKLAPLLAQHITAPSLQQMAAFASLFIATLLVGSAISYLISSLVKVTGLSGTDRMLGVIFGLARGIVITMMIVLYLPKFVPVQEDSWWQQSILIPHFIQFEDKFRSLTASIYELVWSFF